jgi:hypothetical protein
MRNITCSGCGDKGGQTKDKSYWSTCPIGTGFRDRQDNTLCIVLSVPCPRTPKNRAYHNKEWAAKMKTIGLHPSDTGQVGGKETGARVSQYIVAGGRFAIAFAKLAATGWHLKLESAQLAGGRHPNSKVKFTCSCGQNAWGKHDLAIDAWTPTPSAAPRPPDAEARARRQRAHGRAAAAASGGDGER